MGKFYRGLMFLSGSAFILCADPAEALQSIDNLSGLDRSFEAGYTLRSQAESYHGSEVQEFVLEGESALYVEGEEEKQELDLWQYKRALGGGVVYNTNAKGLAHDPTGDLTYTLSPTLGMSRKSENTSVDLGYSLTSARNAHNRKAASVSHSLSSAVKYKFNKINIDFSDSFSPRSVLAQGERTDLVTDNSSQKSIFAFTNNLNFSTGYALTPKTNVSFSYNNSLSYFPVRSKAASTTSSRTSNVSSSVMTHTYKPKISYALTPKIKIFGEYMKEINDYFKGGLFGSKAQTLQIGGQAPGWFKTRLTASGGYFIREYTDFGKPASIGFIYNLGISRALTKKVAVSFSMAKQLGEKFDTTLTPSLKTETEILAVNVSYAVAHHLSLSGSASVSLLNRGGFVSAVDPENSTQTFTRPDEAENYTGGIGLDWRPRKFFSIFFGYDFINQKAPFNSSESKSHRFAVSALGKF